MNNLTEEQTMNTFKKYCPNVFVAECTQEYEKGSTIILTTKYGKDVECIVFNLVGQRADKFYYSIVRADGYNAQEHARRKAERLEGYSATAEAKSTEYWKASHEGRDFLSLGEPIKVGHHSEKRHRALIERNHNRMGKSVEFTNKAEAYRERAEYWKSKEGVINLSMPESIEYYEHKIEEAKIKHEGLKSGAIERRHSFSLTYAKKELNDAIKNLETAKKLWG